MTTVADKRFIDYLYELAKDVTPVGSKKSRIVAAVVISKNVAFIANNAEKTDPLAKRYQRREHAEFIHAEIAAIKRAVNHFRGNIDALRGATIYVARAKQTLDGEWEFGNSKPCAGCAKAIKDYGIKKVYFSLDDEEEIGETLLE